MVSTLEEVALHQQNIEKIEAIGQLCPKMKILYLQNNLIGKIQNLHKLKEKANRDADEKKAAAAAKPGEGFGSGPAKPARHDAFPPVEDGERVYQKNEGRWEFSLEESADGCSLVLDIAVGRFLDTSLIQTDLQPTYVRLLVKGKLLQLLLPCEVRPDASTAQRNTSNGHLVVTMPKDDPADPVVDVARLRPRVAGTTGTAAPGAAAAAAAASTSGHGGGGSPEDPGEGEGKGGRGGAGGKAGGKAGASIYNIVRTPGAAGGDFTLKEVRRAAVAVVAEGDAGDGDDPPDL
ncbi:Protein TILB [Tetrabaena socialis]|uniref:Protein TILB n=1 Tax=Tetrabaena socialis TaxID=47790 RepID=A0A2J8A9K7_9CHLO|nr:Protein TILB [Tetrabaena socialis]|eukprot:PNH09206.1 Protein TILB [Tetrabaena socialis]